MRPTDLFWLPLVVLWQQKLRTALTTLGVIFGAFVLAASLSIGDGVQKTIDRESRRSDIARRVEVFPKWMQASTKSGYPELKIEGKMSDARRERIRRSIAVLNERSNPARKVIALTPERLHKIGALPHVQSAVPLVENFGFAILGKKSSATELYSVRPDDPACRRRIVAGRFFDAPNERAVVVSELLAYHLGLVNDADVDDVIGKMMRFEFRPPKTETGFHVYLTKRRGIESLEERAALERIAARLGGALEKLGISPSEAEALRKAARDASTPEPKDFSEEFTVIGVVREWTEDELKEPRDPLRVDSDVLLPYQTAMDLYFSGPGTQGRGVNRAVVVVDSESNVKDVVSQVIAMGLEGRAAVEFIDRQRLIYLLIFGGMTCVAAVALLVAALGIANTMLMSIIERTREIGIMKAVGADNRHLQLIFLFEGALIGLVGAAIGLCLAWAASYPGDAWVRSLVMRDIKIDLKESIFVFPPWMAAVVLLFTVLVTTLAAVFPARHAARIDPVAALRHE